MSSPNHNNHDEGENNQFNNIRAVWGAKRVTSPVLSPPSQRKSLTPAVGGSVSSRAAAFSSSRPGPGEDATSPKNPFLSQVKLRKTGIGSGLANPSTSAFKNKRATDDQKEEDVASPKNPFLSQVNLRKTGVVKEPLAEVVDDGGVDIRHDDAEEKEETASPTPTKEESARKEEGEKEEEKETPIKNATASPIRQKPKQPPPPPKIIPKRKTAAEIQRELEGDLASGAGGRRNNGGDRNRRGEGRRWRGEVPTPEPFKLPPLPLALANSPEEKVGIHGSNSKPEGEETLPGVNAEQGTLRQKRDAARAKREEARRKANEQKKQKKKAFREYMNKQILSNFDEPVAVTVKGREDDSVASDSVATSKAPQGASVVPSSAAWEQLAEAGGSAVAQQQSIPEEEDTFKRSKKKVAKSYNPQDVPRHNTLVYNLDFNADKSNNFLCRDGEEGASQRARRIEKEVGSNIGRFRAYLSCISGAPAAGGQVIIPNNAEKLNAYHASLIQRTEKKELEVGWTPQEGHAFAHVVAKEEHGGWLRELEKTLHDTREEIREALKKMEGMKKGVQLESCASALEKDRSVENEIVVTNDSKEVASAATNQSSQEKDFDNVDEVAFEEVPTDHLEAPRDEVPQSLSPPSPVESRKNDMITAAEATKEGKYILWPPPADMESNVAAFTDHTQKMKTIVAPLPPTFVKPSGNEISIDYLTEESERKVPPAATLKSDGTTPLPASAAKSNGDESAIHGLVDDVERPHSQFAEEAVRALAPPPTAAKSSTNNATDDGDDERPIELLGRIVELQNMEVELTTIRKQIIFAATTSTAIDDELARYQDSGISSNVEGASVGLQRPADVEKDDKVYHVGMNDAASATKGSSLNHNENVVAAQRISEGGDREDVPLITPISRGENNEGNFHTNDTDRNIKVKDTISNSSLNREENISMDGTEWNVSRIPMEDHASDIVKGEDSNERNDDPATVRSEIKTLAKKVLPNENRNNDFDDLLKRFQGREEMLRDTLRGMTNRDELSRRDATNDEPEPTAENPNSTNSDDLLDGSLLKNHQRLVPEETTFREENRDWDGRILTAEEKLEKANDNALGVISATRINKHDRDGRIPNAIKLPNLSTTTSWWNKRRNKGLVCITLLLIAVCAVVMRLLFSDGGVNDSNGDNKGEVISAVVMPPMAAIVGTESMPSSSPRPSLRPSNRPTAQPLSSCSRSIASNYTTFGLSENNIDKSTQPPNLAVDGTNAVVVTHDGDVRFFSLVDDKWEQAGFFPNINRSTKTPAVALSGNVAVVGFLYQVLGFDVGTGGAYVYERDNTTGRWKRVSILTPDEKIDDSAKFGWSVDIDADQFEPLIVVSAHGENRNKGSVYVFEQSRKKPWTMVGKVLPVPPSNADRGVEFNFGYSVAIHGNLIAATTDCEFLLQLNSYNRTSRSVETSQNIRYISFDLGAVSSLVMDQHNLVYSTVFGGVAIYERAGSDRPFDLYEQLDFSGNRNIIQYPLSIDKDILAVGFGNQCWIFPKEGGIWSDGAFYVENGLAKVGVPSIAVSGRNVLVGSGSPREVYHYNIRDCMDPMPTQSPTHSNAPTPTTPEPTTPPSLRPSVSMVPTQRPITKTPTSSPTSSSAPTDSHAPSSFPSYTNAPTWHPSLRPSISSLPTVTTYPSLRPSISLVPTATIHPTSSETPTSTNQKQQLSRTACLTKEQCRTKKQEMGMSTFFTGSYSTKGCYSKDDKVFFSLGTEEEMSDPELPGVRIRIWCDDGAVPTSQENRKMRITSPAAPTSPSMSPVA